MPRQLTVRGLPDEAAKRLARMSRDRGRSVNATIVDILERAVDVKERRARLERYANWTEQDLAEFEAALATQRVVDEALWR